MHRILLLFMFLFTITITSTAQLIGSRHEQYLKLFSGDTLHSDSITYQNVGIENPVFHYDEELSITTDSVEFLSNFHGTFANLYKVKRKQSDQFGLRIRKGKLDVYEQIDMEIYGGRHLAIQKQEMNLAQHPELASGEEYDYYSIGEGPVKKVSYRNLLLDINSVEESAAQLRAFKRYRYLQFGLVGAGAGIAAASILLQTGPAKINPLTATGFIVAGCSFFVRYPKRDSLKNAIDFYND